MSNMDKKLSIPLIVGGVIDIFIISMLGVYAFKIMKRNGGYLP